MSQEQPRRKLDDQKLTEPIKYGDIFPVEGELAEKPVTAQDAARMQNAESVALGQTLKGGAAAMMQAAAAKNESAGLVGHDEMSAIVDDSMIDITEIEIPGRNIITESLGEQVMTEYNERVPLTTILKAMTDQQNRDGGGITIGEALEATALTVGEKPVEWSDAAAIQAAEVRATGRMNIVPGGVAATAQSAATHNARTTNDEDKTKLADILKDARSKLPADRVATRRDAEGVTGAEMRNDPLLTTHPTGVAASVAAAARMNQNKN